MADLEAQIDALWEHRDDMTAVMSETEAAVCVRAAIDLLDRGEVRVAGMVGDDAVIGSRCMVVDGARVGNGAVLGAGLILSGTIPVIDADTGEEISRGVIPDWSVAVSATRPRTFPGGEFGMPCALVIKRL